MDGTFKIVKKPFVQLHTTHSFIRVGNQKKMAPLLYVLMSRRSRRDYKIIFKFILEIVLKNIHEVTQFVVDFEKAVWLALKDVFGDSVKIFWVWVPLDPMHLSSTKKARINNRL